MSWGAAASKLNDLAEKYYTFNQKMDRMEQDLRDLRGEIASLTKDHLDVKMRVGILEEARKTIDAQVDARITRTIAEWRVQLAQASASAQANSDRPAPLPALPPAPEGQG
jgi:predicted  nucleic acid-binding Zn-ribbon protein